MSDTPFISISLNSCVSRLGVAFFHEQYDNLEQQAVSLSKKARESILSILGSLGEFDISLTEKEMDAYVLSLKTNRPISTMKVVNLIASIEDSDKPLLKVAYDKIREEASLNAFSNDLSNTIEGSFPFLRNE